MELSAAKLSTKDQYRLLIGSVLPRPIALVTTQSSEGIVNAAPFSFFNIVAYDPAIVSVSIQRVDGEMKDTSRNILAQREAVIHIVDAENVGIANEAAARLPYNESELLRMNATLQSSKTIQTPAIAEAKVYFETQLYSHEVIMNDEGKATADLFLLRVTHFHVADSVYDNGRINIETLNAVSRLAGSDYAYIGERFSKERPQ